MCFAVIGLSRLGLFTATRLLAAGYRVLGYDKSGYVASRVLQGRAIDDDRKTSAFVRRLGSEGAFTLAETIGSAVRESDVVVICEKAPANDRKMVQLRRLYEAADSIGKNLRSGLIIVMQTLAPPGTARLFVGRFEKLSGLTCGKEFDFVYAPSPLRGPEDFEDRSVPRVVAGSTPEATSLISEMFEAAGLGKSACASTLEAAEMAVMHMHAESCLRQALRAEFAVLCERMNVDLDETEKLSGMLQRNPPTRDPALYARASAAVLTNLLEAGRSKRAKLSLSRRARDLCWALPQSIARILIRRMKSQGLGAKSSVVVIGRFRELDTLDKRSHPELEILTAMNRAKLRPRASRSADGETRRSELGVHLRPVAVALKKSDCVVILTRPSRDIQKIRKLGDIKVFDYSR